MVRKRRNHPSNVGAREGLIIVITATIGKVVASRATISMTTTCIAISM